MSIREAYESIRYEWSDIVEHLDSLVGLALDIDARTVIELGVRDGNSTLAWLWAMEQTGGHLWSVDVNPPGRTIESSHWTFVQGDDRDGDVMRQLPDSTDIVFIDTSHTFSHTRAELRLYGPRVRRSGLIVLHDTELEWPDEIPPGPAYPVKRAIEEYVAETGYEWTNDPTDNGLAVITTPEVLRYARG